MNTAIENLISLNNTEDHFISLPDTLENRQIILAVVNNLVDAHKSDDWRNSRKVTGYLDNFYFSISWFPTFKAKASKYNKNPKEEPAHFSIRYWEYNPELSIEEIKIVQQVKAMDWTYQYAEGSSYYAGSRQEGQVRSLLRENSSLPEERKILIFREANVGNNKDLYAWAYKSFELNVDSVKKVA